MSDGPLLVHLKNEPVLGAWKVTEDNIHKVAKWCGGWVDGRFIFFRGEQDQGYAQVGHWVMRGTIGNYFDVDQEFYDEHYRPAPAGN